MPTGQRYRAGRNRGYSANPNKKILQVNRDQGVNIEGQQATSRTIYDAIPLLANAGNGVQLTLFENCKTRSFPLTNLQENKLQVKESLTMQRFSFYIIECSSGTTNCLAVMPLFFFPQFERLYSSTFDFQIGQDTVIKKKPFADMMAPFNKDARFFGALGTRLAYTVPVLGAGPAQAAYEVPIDLDQGIPHDVAWFDNDIIIRPQVEFKCVVTVPPVALPTGFDYFLAMKIEGLGSLYAPKVTL